MVIDTSAMLATLFDEPERRRINRKIEAAEVRLMSAASYVETAIVIESRFGYEGGRDLSFFIQTAGIEIVPVDPDQAEIARQAHRRFGRGRHPADLDIGDCFAYALAKTADLPLLFKGEAFKHTDVRLA